ncbi:MAG: hypothetical protein JWP61_1791 [Friedmanniella sp.]|nr:hypothetical protein [Friedmanniella sp.]
MLMVGVMGVTLLFGGVGVVVTSYLVGYHRVRAAADLVALSGATAYGQGEDACVQARRSATQNRVSLVGCTPVGDLTDFVVTVQVSVPIQVPLPGLPRTVGAESHAGPVR